MENIGCTIGKLCINQFNALSKTGKPKVNEWTILSCIVKEQNFNFEVVALGTGSKCIGKFKMCPNGTILNDSHAEVICRRAFLRYLYTNMQKESLIFSFNQENCKFSLKRDIRFHFFTTHVPCGDAAIFPKQDDEDFGKVVASETTHLTEEEVPAKKRRTDIFRTGAKCLTEDSRQDLKAEGTGYHIVGVVRTKPGRGDPTLSVSCSDKLSKWCHLGIQGALLMQLLASPIYLATFTILSSSQFCEKSLERALFDRLGSINMLPPYARNICDVKIVDLEFPYSKTEGKLPSASSIAWFQANQERYFEVAINGRKQGVTKKQLLSEHGSLKICKLKLFKMFVDKVKEFNPLKAKKINIEKLSYANAKKLDEVYQKNWDILKEKFGVWPRKELSLLDFSISQ